MYTWLNICPSKSIDISNCWERVTATATKANPTVTHESLTNDSLEIIKRHESGGSESERERNKKILKFGVTLDRKKQKIVSATREKRFDILLLGIIDQLKNEAETFWLNFIARQGEYYRELWILIFKRTPEIHQFDDITLRALYAKGRLSEKKCWKMKPARSLFDNKIINYQIDSFYDLKRAVPAVQFNEKCIKRKAEWNIEGWINGRVSERKRMEKKCFMV